MKRFDAMVLGAGMVGIGTALHLLERGRSVALVDRRTPAEETSFGNAGLIQCEAVMPYAFPRHLPTIAGVLAGRRTEARVHLALLPKLAPWLLAYALQSSKGNVARTAAANAPLVGRAVAEHRRLMERAGIAHLMRSGGYLRLFREEAALEAAIAENEAVREAYGVAFDVWNADRLRAEEPHLAADLVGAIHSPEPQRVDDPGDVGAAYASLFEHEGGTILRGDAASLCREADGWSVVTAAGRIGARDVVIALGPWSREAMAAQRSPVPLRVKRGYHKHFAAKGNAVLSRLVVDEAHGIVLTPNRRGLRLTTGAEFADRDAPPTPRQMERAEPIARELFPLGEALQATPWLGARPCLPDLLPMVGPVPGRAGLWANFGHHHLGLTLGPTTGRLLAELIAGEDPFTDPTPYAVDRF